jgi:hypothetical protein
MSAPGSPGDQIERFVRLETKLDLLLQQIMPKQDDHEARIRKLERMVWLAAGSALAGGGAAGAIASQITGA